MKSRKVDYVTSDAENVRLNIYDGDIPLGDAGAKLLDCVVKNHERSGTLVAQTNHTLAIVEKCVAQLATPWPVRWWRYFKNR